MRVLILFVLLLCAAPPALATDFTQPLLNEDGKPYERCVGPPKPEAQVGCEKEPITLGVFIYDALNASEPTLKPDELVARGLLALKIKRARDLELDDKQRDLVKAALHASVKYGNFPVPIVQALKIIDVPLSRRGDQ